MKTRSEKIKALRDKNKTYREIGKVFKISRQRAYQIVRDIQRGPSHYCEIHNRKYYDQCDSCVAHNEYSKKLDQLMKNGVMKEVEELTEPDRSAETIIRKKLLITVLRERYDMSFPQIGKLLERDHTSIMNLYYK